MSASVLYMSMSLDGYIAGPNDDAGNPGGDGFARLHEWFVAADGEFFRPSGPNPYQSCRRMKPSPPGLPGSSFEPAMYPSSDIDM